MLSEQTMIIQSSQATHCINNTGCAGGNFSVNQNILNDKHYIGDFPPPPDYWHDQLYPLIPWAPGSIKQYEFIPFQPIITTFVPNPVVIDSSATWRVSYDDVSVMLSVDFAGVNPKDMSIEIRDGNIIHVGGRRFDTHGFVTRTYALESLYDAKSATATIESGVLTIMVLKSKTSNVHKVPVTVK